MKRTAPQAGGPSARAARVSAAAGALHLAAGDLDREYRTLGVLGRGNFSEVNLLRHRTSGELFALKTCCKLEAPSLEHLKRESTLMARVRHPFLLTPQRVVDQRGAPRWSTTRCGVRRKGWRTRAISVDSLLRCSSDGASSLQHVLRAKSSPDVRWRSRFTSEKLPRPRTPSVRYSRSRSPAARWSAPAAAETRAARALGPPACGAVLFMRLCSAKSWTTTARV